MKKIIAAACLVAVTALAAGCDTGAASDHPFTAKAQHGNGGGKGGNSKPDPLAGLTGSQKQAVGSAQDYLQTGHFSEAGLIEQLSSKYGEGFSKKDAAFAVHHIKVNWNQQAVGSGKDYLSTGHFSRAALIQQLASPFGEKFTRPQAVYAANHLGL